jgi:tripartite-type tricarboxylate transporter receptor subunit TctC
MTLDLQQEKDDLSHTMTKLASNSQHKVSRHVCASVALACVLVAGSVQLSAQDYPTRPVRIIVPFPAGGGADVIGRTLAQKLTETLAQNVIVENRAGAAGNIGTEAVARAAPDGYTLLVPGPNFTANVHLFRKIPFDPIKDFEPISLLTSAQYILVVHPSLPVRSVKELIALARAKPGQINYGSAGSGSANHLGMELIKMMAKIDLQHVPYKGGAPMQADLLGGQISLAYDNILTIAPHIQSGRVRALAVSGARRTPLLPDLPTVAEAGLPGYDVAVWVGFLAPAGTPANILNRLQDATIAGMQKPEVRERMATLGADVIASTRQEFAAFIKTDIEKAGRIIRQGNIRLE